MEFIKCKTEAVKVNIQKILLKTISYIALNPYQYVPVHTDWIKHTESVAKIHLHYSLTNGSDHDNALFGIVKCHFKVT